ncbi:MAG TPA: flagellar basal-body rod protein FlgF [Steroidobacteraceae bacterium]|jgi:flagellar hook protein FlgE|nr:flagellar basal-body rod protein FlgF [Steroidobacteraceae bacterium]
MTILNAVYTGMSGMLAYQQGLTIIGNNVANLDTSGFKSTEPLFEDLEFQTGTGGFAGSPGTPTIGGGVSVDDTHVSFAQGNEQATGDPLDAAVNGLGFFVVQRNGSDYYTRAGQFQFDQDGDLVQTTTGAKVMVSTSTSAIGSFNIKAYNSYAPVETTTVALSGNLASSGQTAPYVLPGITVVDGGGGTETLQATFTQDSANPLHWTVQVQDASNKIIGTGDLFFNADGSLATTTTPIVVTVTPSKVPAFKINLTFGTAGGFTGVTSLASNSSSQLQVASQDGVQLGTLTGTSFGSDGSLTLTYSNGKTLNPAKLLLAQFEAPQQLKAVDNGLFSAVGNALPVLGTALSTNFGSIVGGEVEMSNVDLSQEFTELIIIQRGYQASSQIASMANDMMQQLLTMGNQR